MYLIFSWDIPLKIYFQTILKVGIPLVKITILIFKGGNSTFSKKMYLAVIGYPQEK